MASPRKQRPNSSATHMLVNWLNNAFALTNNPLKVKSLRDLKDAVMLTKLGMDLVKKSFLELDDIYREMPELVNDASKRFECISQVISNQLDMKSAIDYDLAAEGNEFELAKVRSSLIFKSKMNYLLIHLFVVRLRSYFS